MSLTPLELPGWVEFNTRRSGLKEHRVEINHGSASVRAVLYLDRRGRIRLPDTNAYVPVVFHSERRRPTARTSQWLDVAAGLVEEMAARGFANQVRLPPEIDDVRPFQWGGLLVRPYFTYCLDFPADPSDVDPDARRLADKAARAGMTVERVDDIGLVVDCLNATEARKGFSYGVDESQLRLVQSLLGTDHFRSYVCFDADGIPSAATVLLHAPGARAIEWLAGVKPTPKTDGASCLVFRHFIQDLEAAGASGIDFAGANIKQVAMFKAQWGGRLLPTFSVRTYSLRAGARFLADWRASP